LRPGADGVSVPANLASCAWRTTPHGRLCSRSRPKYPPSRIRRADYLAGRHPFAAEILRFYSQIAKFQKRFYLEAAKDLAKPPRGRSPYSLRDASYFLDAANTVPKLASFLSLVEQTGPPPLAAAARDIAKLETTSKRSLLEAYWDLGGKNDHLSGPFAQFIPRAFLQPLAELAAGTQSAAPALSTQHTCPLCGGQPMLGVLRQEGDGGKRLMLCSFCLHEWDFRRCLDIAMGSACELECELVLSRMVGGLVASLNVSPREPARTAGRNQPLRVARRIARRRS